MIRLLQTIASTQKQRTFQRGAPAANVAEELVCQWFDDFHPESELFRQAFTAREIAPLVWFHRVFDKRANSRPNSFDSLLNSGEWTEVVRQAQITLDANNWTREAP